LNLLRTSIYLFLKATAEKKFTGHLVRWVNENYQTAGKFIGCGPSVRCQFPWLYLPYGISSQYFRQTYCHKQTSWPC